jgi:hypothetical protein
MKLLEKNTMETLQDTGLGRLLIWPQKHKGTKAKIEKWDYIKIKTSCIAKETTERVKRQPIQWENICKLFIRQGFNIQNI